jgi:hypothetical protein
MAFDTNVFINCPFDDDYLPLLRPLLFCIVDLGFEPQISLEILDSGRPRIENIISLIQGSRYAIHDLSRLRARRKGDYFRLNMPFELGLDIGCRLFGSRTLGEKRCLILEAERYRYQAALSDLSNSDIAVHENQPVKLLSKVRDWLNRQARLRAPGPSAVWSRFNEFMAWNYDKLTVRGFSHEDITEIQVGELLESMRQWKSEN